MKEFKTKFYLKKEPIKFGKVKIPIFWTFKELKKDDIALMNNGEYAIFKGCGCTADIKVTDEGISAIYNDNTKKEDIEIAGGEKIITKVVRVFLKDEHPLFINNSRGMKVPNPDKKNVLLSFSIIVQI